MSRYSLWGVISDGNGAAVASASVAIKLADTSTTPTMYDAKTSGSLVTSATTDSKGYWIVYVDDSDYPLVTLFDITVSKTGHVTQVYPDAW